MSVRSVSYTHLDVYKRQDLTVIVEGKTMKEVALFVAQRLAPIDQVLSTSTHFILKRYKDHGIVLEDHDRDERMIVSP